MVLWAEPPALKAHVNCRSFLRAPASDPSLQLTSLSEKTLNCSGPLVLHSYPGNEMEVGNILNPFYSEVQVSPLPPPPTDTAVVGLCNCPGWLPCVCDKMLTKTNMGRKEVVWLTGYSSPSRETRAGAQEPGGRNPTGTRCPRVGWHPRGCSQFSEEKGREQ